MSTTESLAVRVSRVIANEHLIPLDRCEREPAPSRSKATKRESDMRAWGMAYGVAFGLLLADDPDGDFDTLAEDALDGARAAFTRWSGTITSRQPFSPAIDEMLLAFEGAHPEIELNLTDHPPTRTFLEKMQGLIEAIGMPESAVSA
jgi:hypothetical protein